MSLFFDATHLPQPASEYVAWIDVMGTQSSMSRSLNATANFIFKLHSAALQAATGSIRLYPVMDGLYAAGSAQSQMLDFLRSVFQQVAEEFNQTQVAHHRFIIRGALAFGPVIHGADVSAQASTVLASNLDYRRAILLGMPMVQAHLSEASAPPFGISVHDSARVFAPPGHQPLHAIWWSWRNTANQETWLALKPALMQHLQWCSERSMSIGYPADRLKEHQEMVRQLFAQ